MKKQKNKKKRRRKNEKLKNMCFLRYDTFFTKNGGLNRWAITGVLLKTRDKNIIKNCTTENKKNIEFSKKNIKNDVLETSKSQRYSDYSGFVKSRVGESMHTAVGGTAPFSFFFCRKWEIQEPFLHPWKSERAP